VTDVPLDQQTTAFIEQSRANPGPEPGDMPLADFRKAVEVLRPLMFDRIELADVRDVEIPFGDRTTRARLFVPEADAPPPLIVWTHGGSWVRVTVDLFDTAYRMFAQHSGCAMLAVDYELSPESQYPAPLEEVYNAAVWARAHGAELGDFDLSRLALAGESSGGNMAAAITYLDRDRGEVGFSHQILIAPVLDASFSTPSWQELGADYLLTPKQLDWALEQYAPGADRTDPMISPLAQTDLAGLPPAYITSGEFDPLRDEDEAYAKALEAAGVTVRYVCFDGIIHHTPMVPKLLPLAEPVTIEIARGFGDFVRTV
jgi:acetyl esterase/lipase